MKRTDRISPVVWAIGIIVIAATIFFAWIAKRPHRDMQHLEQQAPVPALSDDAAILKASPTQALAVTEPSGGLSGLVPVPLAKILIPAENGSWLKDADYLLVPHEPQDFGGIRFLMDGLLQLQGQYSRDIKNRSYRADISVPLPVTNLVGSVHLLGGTRYGEQPQEFAQLAWHYQDGSIATTPLANLTHFRDWVRNPYEQPAHLPYPFSKVVWAMATAPNRTLRLYRVSLANPQPKKVVQSLEFFSEMKEPTLFLCGVTLDPLKPGARPDNTADLEPTDALPGRTLQIAVTDPSGSPLPNSQLHIESMLQDGSKNTRSTSLLTTDARGVATVGYPPENLNTFEVSASHENFSARKMKWNVKSGDVVPASYTLKLASEITIGGIVVDAGNNPVPAAAISLSRFWSGGEDDPNKKGEQSDFRTQKQTTGPDGRWRATGLPAELMDHIDLGVAHTNFLGTNITVGGNESIEKQLRAETLKIVLLTGTGAHGLVTDENDNPVAGATVWVGRKYYRDRQETKTDSHGRFSFQHVTEGDMPFSVSATGHAPATKTITVKSDMPDILFKLGAGHVLHGTVQDDSGSPISGVQVSLENDMVGQGDYEFSANTDSDGKFSWDGAPAEPLKFYFGKQGYEQKRNVSLTPDQDNTITLRTPRKLEGLVLDSNSGQPIPQFTIRTGHRSDASGNNVYGVIRNQDFNSADGHFSTEIDEADDNAVQVWNDDHSLKTESFPDEENGVIQLTIRLDPSAALKGTVTTADGVPVPGANVVAISGDPGMSVQFLGNHLRSYNEQTKVATTDDQGAFTLSAPPDHGTVVATADVGFASTSIDQVRANPVVVLQAFGRIEGTLKIAGAPGAGQDLLYSPAASGLSVDFNTFKTTTDDQGNFTMERIPPGDGSIVRLIHSSANSWTYSHNTPVTVQPGQTTQVTLGDTGAVLRGTVRFDSPPTNGGKWIISGNLFGGGPIMPAFNSPAERQAYIRSPEWQAQTRTIKNYAFVANADGTFQVDSVAPGSYNINVSARVDGDRAFMNPPVAQGSLQFTVPDNADPLNPIAVGEIVLKSTPPVINRRGNTFQ